MTNNALRATIASVLAVLALPSRAAHAQAVEPSTHESEPAHPPADDIVFSDGLAYRGTARVPLKGPDFYLAVDRPDLAELYRQRQENRSIGETLGVTVMMVGLGWGLIDGVGHMFDGLLGSQSRRGSMSPWPWVTAAGGLSVFVGFHRWSPDPVGQAERLELARTHNRRAVSVVPQLTPGGGGLAVVGRF